MAAIINFGNNPEVTRSSTEHTQSAMTRIDFNPRRGVVGISVSSWMVLILSSATSNCVCHFVCDLMSFYVCSNPAENCVEKLASLPVVEGTNPHVGGNYKGCRFLYAVLATFDDKHCARLEFEPTLDIETAFLPERDRINDQIKCQEQVRSESADFIQG